MITRRCWGYLRKVHTNDTMNPPSALLKLYFDCNFSTTCHDLTPKMPTSPFPMVDANTLQKKNGSELYGIFLMANKTWFWLVLSRHGFYRGLFSRIGTFFTPHQRSWIVFNRIFKSFVIVINWKYFEGVLPRPPVWVCCTRRKKMQNKWD